MDYRGLINGVMKRLGLTFENALSTVSAVIRSISHEVTASEAAALKSFLPAELRQLINEVRVRGTGAGNHSARIVELVSVALELGEEEAKRRALAVTLELRARVTLWDDVKYVELLDRIISEIDSTAPGIAVA